LQQVSLHASDSASYARSARKHEASWAVISGSILLYTQVQTPQSGRLHCGDGRIAVPPDSQIRQLIVTSARAQLVNLEDRLNSRLARIHIDERAEFAFHEAQKIIIFLAGCNDALRLATVQVDSKVRVAIRRQLKQRVPAPISTRSGAEPVAQFPNC
jgi:hypothetical protein